ncbi:MAG: DUF983 domain-containing protein [Chitinophagia bacterium]|nr:DUF983 domain-containing protein [Chitinophagia bacterium]
MEPSKKRSSVVALLSMKCPQCQGGDIFSQKGIFPLKHLADVNMHCSVCGLKMVSERNNGAGINYALTVIVFFLNLCWYWPIFGLSYTDNSTYYYLASSTVITVLLQPWLMRLSRAMYVYAFYMARDW